MPNSRDVIVVEKRTESVNFVFKYLYLLITALIFIQALYYHFGKAALGGRELSINVIVISSILVVNHAAVYFTGKSRPNRIAKIVVLLWATIGLLIAGNYIDFSKCF